MDIPFQNHLTDKTSANIASYVPLRCGCAAAYLRNVVHVKSLAFHLTGAVL
jgi:hypothetical protein